MPRRRWIFTENGRPLDKPREVILDTEKPEVPEILRPVIPAAAPSFEQKTPESPGTWTDYDGEE